MQKKQADLRYAHQQSLLQSGVVDPSMYPMAPRMEIPVYPTNHQQFFQKPEGFGIIAPDWRSQEQHQQHMHGTIKKNLIALINVKKFWNFLFEEWSKSTIRF